MHSERCPVCNGKGTIPQFSNTTSTAEITCHGCNGKGWVEVGDENVWEKFPVKPFEPLGGE